MKLKSGISLPPFKLGTEQRPWGYYGLYSNNEICTTKILYIKKDEMLSLQYHFKRDQFYLMLDDDFTVDYSKQPVPGDLINEPNEDWRINNFNKFLEEHLVSMEAYEGDMFGFNRKVIHRTAYHGSKEYGRVLDVAFGINDEEDIVRLRDKYNRITK